MSVEEKLDKIIEILLRIENNVNSTVLNAKIEDELPVKSSKICKPTKGQLEFKRRVEFANRLNSKYYFTSIRKHAAEIIEKRKQNPNLKFVFECAYLEEINKRIAKTGAQFYKDLKVQAEKQCKAIEYDGEQVLARAIGRLKARA